YIHQNNMATYALILLAAGSSNRLGQPKQLLLVNGKPLIVQMADVAFDSHCDQVFVVLGAYQEAIIGNLDQSRLIIIPNPIWEEGVASSIRIGVAEALKKLPSLSGIVFMTCDQPFVSSSLINNLIERKEKTAKPMVASAYRDTMGIPAIFDKQYFPDLMKLKGQEGAKKIFTAHRGSVETISFPQGYIDIDTWEDFQLWRKNESAS
ncbi:MAG TPA: nucleotidyltransferase family protein, partial [Puia sp.]|nr:nucleotidyltransferase family protein [Puia sp.]